MKRETKAVLTIVFAALGILILLMVLSVMALLQAFIPPTRIGPANNYEVGRVSDPYVEVDYVAVYDGRLSNSGEVVRLVDENLAIVTQVFWQTSDPWPVTPDGDGPSLELIAAGGQNGDKHSAES